MVNRIELMIEKIGRHMAKSKVSMKLLINTKSKRVVFAEAGKECVDFLFQILSLPVATIIGLVRMKGSLPKLYRSLQNLNQTYILPKKDKNRYLNPVLSCSVPLLAIGDASTSHSHGWDFDDDDLKVKPMSTISTFTLLKQFKVNDVSDLEEKVVSFGMNEAIKLLKTSLRSKTVLTDVFC